MQKSREPRLGKGATLIQSRRTRLAEVIWGVRKVPHSETSPDPDFTIQTYDPISRKSKTYEAKFDRTE